MGGVSSALEALGAAPATLAAAFVAVSTMGDGELTACMKRQYTLVGARIEVESMGVHEGAVRTSQRCAERSWEGSALCGVRPAPVPPACTGMHYTRLHTDLFRSPPHTCSLTLPALPQPPAALRGLRPEGRGSGGAEPAPAAARCAPDAGLRQWHQDERERGREGGGGGHRFGGW